MVNNENCTLHVALVGDLGSWARVEGFLVVVRVELSVPNEFSRCFYQVVPTSSTSEGADKYLPSPLCQGWQHFPPTPLPFRV